MKTRVVLYSCISNRIAEIGSVSPQRAARCMRLALFATIFCNPPAAHAQGTAFTYQGRLNDGGLPANGLYDIRAGLYTTNSGGTVFAGPITNSAVAISNGLFTISLDYGNVLDGTTYWLQVAVRTNGGSAFVIVSPRQQLTPAPYAVFAEGANAAGLAGTLPSGSLSGSYSGAVMFSNAADSFSGNGTGLTNVNAAALNGMSAGNFWQLGGNSISPGQVFGCTNNNLLDLYANGVRALRLILRVDTTGTYSNAPNVIGGSSVNQVSSGTVGGVIGGGGGLDSLGNSLPNMVTADFGMIGGGANNTASGQFSTISGGATNNASGDYGVVAGGLNNTAGGIGSFIGGGGYDGTTAVGNLVNSKAATIGGGLGNSIPGGAQYAFIGGGMGNTNSATWGTISGGLQNAANGDFATVSGGAYNAASGFQSVVAGGLGNTASGLSSTVGGGLDIMASGDYSGVGSGYGNIANAVGSFIGGGGYDGVSGLGNKAQSKAATVGGGLGNNIKGGAAYAVIGGGYLNTNSAQYATIGGGYQNIASGTGSVVAGGGYDGVNFSPGNVASGGGAVVAGGLYNVASGAESTVSGGYNNSATGTDATVPGGEANTASGTRSFAAGTFAQASHDGSFVWADYNFFNYSSSFANGFFARCTGGARFVTAIDGSGNPTAGVKLNSGDTSWSAISDRNAKKNFAQVNSEAVLEKLAVIPVQSWNYKWEADTDTPHIGPMAQDFKAAFYPGRDDKSISTLEFDGVELAAIQGLNQKLNEKDAVIQQQIAEIARLNARLEKLEQTILTQKSD